MSEIATEAVEKPKRTKEEIQADYDEASKQAGDLGYRLAVMEENHTRMHRRMFELNQEAQALEPKPEVPSV